MVPDLFGIETHSFYFGLRSTIVRGIDRIIQQEFGPPLRRVDFNRHYRGRSDQDFVFALFSNNE